MLRRLTNNGDTAKELAQDFDGNEDFVLGIIAFLKDIRWMKEEQAGEYVTTDRDTKSSNASQSASGISSQVTTMIFSAYEVVVIYVTNMINLTKKP